MPDPLARVKAGPEFRRITCISSGVPREGFNRARCSGIDQLGVTSTMGWALSVQREPPTMPSFIRLRLVGDLIVIASHCRLRFLTLRIA